MAALIVLLAFYVLIVGLFTWMALYLLEQVTLPHASAVRTAVIVLAVASVITLVWLVLGSVPKRGA